MFLMGPWRQFKAMLAPQRRWATAVYFAALLGTLGAAFKVWLRAAEQLRCAV